MERRSSPIYSTLADDPTAADAIDAFVLALAERVDDLQDLDARSDANELAPAAGQLGIDATKVGFDSLASTAYAVEDACRQGSASDVHKNLVELTEVARRIRLGHRGSV
jgi:hypothetical protein